MKRSTVQVVFAGVALMAIVLSGALFLRDARFRARETACRSNIFQIGVALYSYHLTERRLPPAHYVDDDGRPHVSWRVILGTHPRNCQQFYGGYYDLSKPWSNQAESVKRSPWGQHFRCPHEPDESQTNYVAIVGRNTLWPGSSGSEFADFQNPSSEKILLLEVPGTNIPWMEPRDVTVNEAVKIAQDYLASDERTTKPLHCYTTANRELDLREIESIQMFRKMLLVDCSEEAEGRENGTRSILGK